MNFYDIKRAAIQNIFLCCCFVFTSLITFSQVSRDGKIYYSKQRSVSELIIDTINNKHLESVWRNSRKYDYENIFAKKIVLGIDLFKVATISKRDSLIVANYILTSEGAKSLNVIFSEFVLPKSARLFLFTPDQKEVIGAFTQENNKESEILATGLIGGETIVIEVQVDESEMDQVKLKLGSLNHGFIDIFKSTSEIYPSDCQVDIRCAEGQAWVDEKNSVVRYIYDGIRYCTGALINNTRFDGMPYLLTANHCIKDQSKAETAVFYFNVENSACGVNDALDSKSISGSDLIATAPNSKLDFSLLKLSVVPPRSYFPYYAGWDVSDDIHNIAVSIHHPHGYPKKIAKSKYTPQTGSFIDVSTDFLPQSHWHIAEWEYGTTEGGSSGAPLFNEEHVIIGNLTGGSADCEEPVNDYFQKLSFSWDYYSEDVEQLKYWLDPIRTGTEFCTGHDPFVLSGNPVSNINIIDSLSVSSFGDMANGTWAGTNDIGVTEVVETLSGVTNHYLYQVNILIGNEDSLKNLSLIVRKGFGFENIVYQQELKESDIIDNSYLSVYLDSAIYVGSDFSIALRFSENSNIDVFCKRKSEDNLGTAYCKIRDDFVAYEELGFKTSLALEAFVTNEPDTANYSIEPPSFINQVYDDVDVVTKELFAYDSSQHFFEWEQLLESKDNDGGNWYGASNNNFTSIVETFENKKNRYLSAIKLGVSDIDINTLDSIELVVYSAKAELPDSLLYSAKVATKKVENNSYNIFRLPNCIAVDTLFFVGVNIPQYESNSFGLFQLKNDINENQTSFFLEDGFWSTYHSIGFENNVAIGVQFANTKYSFFKDKLYSYESPTIQSFQETSSTIKIYPVPVSDILMIELAKRYNYEFNIKIYNSLGETVYINSNAIADRNVFELNVNWLDSGIYVAEIMYDTISEKLKFIVAK